MATSNNRVILFCDCHDFSRLQLVLPGPVLEFVDSFYRVCGECVVAAGGRIVKYIGDSILAVFPEDAVDGAVAEGTRLPDRPFFASHFHDVLDLRGND